MATFVPVSPGLSPLAVSGEPTWVNLDMVAYVTADSSAVAFNFAGGETLTVRCADHMGLAVAQSILNRAGGAK